MVAFDAEVEKVNAADSNLHSETDPIILAKIVIGLATAPPYTPLCKSLLGPVTFTSI